MPTVSIRSSADPMERVCSQALDGFQAPACSPLPFSIDGTAIRPLTQYVIRLICNNLMDLEFRPKLCLTTSRTPAVAPF